MNVRNDKSGPVLEGQVHGIDPSEIWSVAFSTLERVLGRDASRALCFHIFLRTGKHVGMLLLDDPKQFAEVIESIIQCDIDVLLNSISSSLNEAFGLDCKPNSLVHTIRELKEK